MCKIGSARQITVLDKRSLMREIRILKLPGMCFVIQIVTTMVLVNIEHNISSIQPIIRIFDSIFHLLQNIDDSLCGVASYLRKIESERGGSVWSEVR